MLQHASSSRHIDPGRPPAAAGGLRSQYPDLVLRPRQQLDCRQLWQAGRREYRPASATRGRSRVCIDLAASWSHCYLIYIRSRGRRNLNGRRGRPTYLKGVSGNVPTFETAFVLVCHYAISKLCKGMCHHCGARHVSPRLHIHRFRPWAPVPLPGVCFLSTACGSPIAHFKRSCSPSGWVCGKRASGHRGGS